MPTTPSPAQSETSRQNGARSSGPATAAGKAWSSLNGVRHGLCGRTFFLLPDEDPAEFQAHEAMWLAVWSPRDLHEQETAAAGVRCMWREERADRLEAVVLTDLFAAGNLSDPAEAEAAKTAAFKALSTLLRYRGWIEREHRAAMQALESLPQRRLARPPGGQPSEPEKPPTAAVAVPPPAAAPAAAVPATTAPAMPHAARAALPSEPEPAPTLNRHQRRALAAMDRRRAA